MADGKPLAAWQTTKKSLVLETPWFKIHKQRMRMPSGVELDYFVHASDDSVICVCVDEAGNILVERQYRVPVQKVSVDYPAGKVETIDASPQAAIARELREEVGLTAASIKLLGVLDKDPGFSTTRMSVFLARDIHSGASEQEATESIVPVFVSPATIVEMIKTGEMACTYCVSATCLAFTELGLITLNAGQL